MSKAVKILTIAGTLMKALEDAQKRIAEVAVQTVADTKSDESDIPLEFVTHKDAWRIALVHARDTSVVRADVIRWDEELRVFDRAYSQLKA